VPAPVLVDSNVILDIVTEDVKWFAWSERALESAGERGVLVINPLIYSEVSVSFKRIEDLDDALPATYFRREPLPWDAGFLAGKAYVKYRRSSGARRSPLPDFYIGAHAAVNRYTILTRDPDRFRAYFPTVPLITPD
jgi:predicted nucleic acid-binding protein